MLSNMNSSLAIFFLINLISQLNARAYLNKKDETKGKLSLTDLLISDVQDILRGAQKDERFGKSNDINRNEMTVDEKTCLENIAKGKKCKNGGSDIRLPPEGRNSKRVVSGKKWPIAPIYFKFKKGDFNDYEQRAILESVNYFNHQFGCSKMPWKRNDSYNGFHVRFQKSDGCWSYVGMTGYSSDCDNCQPVSIGEGCGYRGIIVHQMMHVMGFGHEQSRTDRDKYVRVLWQNIVEGLQNNFEKVHYKNPESLESTYDYGSLMHYGQYYYSKNGNPTLIAIGGTPEENSNNQHIMGNRENLSPRDVEELQYLYKCGGIHGDGSEEKGTGGNEGGEKGGNEGGEKSGNEGGNKGGNKGGDKGGNEGGNKETVEPVCDDRNSDCPSIIAYCQVEMYLDFLKDLCPKTCKFC